MVLINDNHAISVSLAKVYENCIKDIEVKDVIIHDNKIIMICAWLPRITVIDVSTNEMIIKLKDEKEEVKLGFTGYEWIFDDYINTTYNEGGHK